MPGYVMLEAELIDPVQYGLFREQLMPLLEAQGGRLVARGGVVEAVDGEINGHRRMLIMEFDTVEQAKAWPTLPNISNAYAELREIRNRAAKVSMFIVDSEAPLT